MSNVISVAGNIPTKRYIREMREGEVGYTVPWAYEDGWLDDERFTVGLKGGTASLRIKCVKPGQYSLTFESPYQPVRILSTWDKAARRFRLARLRLAQRERAK